MTRAMTHADEALEPDGPTMPPGSRPTWSGLLQLSLVGIPIKAYPAVRSREVGHLHQLHADCGQRIRYRKHCPVHGTVDADAIVRGYEHVRGQHVVVDTAELDGLRPARDRALRLERFIDPGQVDPVRFAGRSLHLLADGLAAQPAYRLLVEALHRRSQWSVGRVVLGGHRQLVLVRPVAGILILHVLHYPEEVRACPAGAGPAARRPPTAEEVHLAEVVLDAASGPLDWTAFRDERAEELRALIEAKVATKPAAAESANVVLPLLEALKRSVAAAQIRANAPPRLAKTARKRGQQTA